MFGRNKSEPKAEQGTAIWIDEVGSIRFRVFSITERDKEKSTIDFGQGEKLRVNTRFIRRNRILIYDLGNGKIIAENPDNWKNAPLKENGIKEYRFNLQNMALQEGKSAIHRWTLPQDMISKLSPLFKLLFICIVIGVIGWSAFKFAGVVLDMVTSSRIIDCNTILPHPSLPIGVNLTAPIGVK